MVWNRQGTLLDQVDLAHQPLDKYVPAYWRDVTWKRFYDQMMPGVKADPLNLRQQEIAEMLRMIGVLHRGGVEFMAGTDTAPGIYVMPGFSLHDELANFVEAGFSPWRRQRAIRRSFWAGTTWARWLRAMWRIWLYWTRTR